MAHGLLGEPGTAGKEVEAIVTERDRLRALNAQMLAALKVVAEVWRTTPGATLDFALAGHMDAIRDAIRAAEEGP